MSRTNYFEYFLDLCRFPDNHDEEDVRCPFDLKCPDCDADLFLLEGYPFCSECPWDSNYDSDWWRGIY